MNSINYDINNKQSMCIICHNNYILSDILIELNKCSHNFHKNCLEEWFNYNLSCPICREQVVDITLGQYILLYLSLLNSQSPRESSTLKQNAFICVFLHILITTYKTPCEYNSIKDGLNAIRSSIRIDGEQLPTNINISSLSGAKRELKFHMTLMRSQLLQELWSEEDPYHIYDPPYLPHNNSLFMHPYLLKWREKIEAILGL
jgi:hypothetical protein